MKDELRQANMVFREKNRRLDSIVSFHRCCLFVLSCAAILYSNLVQQFCAANSAQPILAKILVSYLLVPSYI